MISNYMLDYFGVGHFKSFGPAQVVHFKPITLLFGANSAGKSSFLQALLLLKHALETGDFDAHEVTSGGELVNLGGIPRMLHQHDADQAISLIIGTRVSSSLPDASAFGVTEVKLRLMVGIEGETAHSQPTVREGLTRAGIILNGSPFGIFSVTGHVHQDDASRYGLDRIASAHKLNWGHPLLKELLLNRANDVRRILNLTDSTDDQQQAIAGLIATAVREDLSVEQGDLLRGVLKRSNMVFLSDEEGIMAWEAPRPEFRYLHALCPLLDDPISEAFWELVGLNDYLLDEKDIARGVGIDFFSNVFADVYTYPNQGEPCQATLNAREAYKSDAILAARWAQARDASRLMAYLRDDILQLILGAFTAVRTALEPLTFLGPLRTVPERHFGGKQPRDSRQQASGSSAWNLLRDDAEVRERVNTWMSVKLGLHYQVRLRPMFDEAQVEYQKKHARHVGLQNAASWLTFYLPEALSDSGVETDQITKVWKYIRRAVKEEREQRRVRTEKPVFEHDLIKVVPDELLDDESWLEDATSATGSSFDHYFSLARTMEYLNERHDARQHRPAAEELTLHDSRNQVDVGARDVGLGISQVLPVLVHAAAGARRTVLIEQPELHLHPALQAELADVLVEAVRQSQQTFVLETHSEHLILRLLRRIRETTDPEVSHESALHLTVDDLAVLYASPSSDGTQIEEVTLTPDGDFEHHWPPGFFADRSKELF